ncbi:MAG: polyphosphate kinase 1 [Deltaproteobacteria bacterium]|jgi:polyphosphate kinase|nr:polyphosphate kinase 1 [Deltaproteobacteria bacterium]
MSAKKSKHTPSLPDDNRPDQEAKVDYLVQEPLVQEHLTQAPMEQTLLEKAPSGKAALGNASLESRPGGNEDDLGQDIWDRENWDKSELFFNRELNWLEFNRKVLAEAAEKSNPLLERVKFLAIFHNNLEEFFMVRVAGLTRQRKLGVGQTSIDGLSTTEQLVKIRRRVTELLKEAEELWSKTLHPELFKNGLKFVTYQNLSSKEKTDITDFFQRDIYPILTPQALDKGRPFPQISGGSLNLFIELTDKVGKIYHARLKIPDNLKRFICLPVTHGSLDSQTMRRKFSSSGVKVLPLEMLIIYHLKDLFPGYKVVDSLLFRITRNTDIEIEEDEADDLLIAVRELIYQRRFGEVVKLETPKDSPKRLVDILMKSFDLEPWQHYVIKGRLVAENLMDLTKLDIPKLRFSPFVGRTFEKLKKGNSFFDILKKRDVFLYHPYDSFSPVEDFVRQAALDPQVKAIKQTLYRTGDNSSIVESLIEARRAEKQVTAVVELKARFDEMRNITWARALEEVGINVVYGLVGMKIHAKLCLVIRQEDVGLRSYLHLGTGNYNPVTAKIYADCGLLTSEASLCHEAVRLFNVMTGLAQVNKYERFLVSPGGVRLGLLERIEREIKLARAGEESLICLKINQLSDPDLIMALYRASQAGVEVRLQVRGVCCLRPGVPGLSEGITVTSIVGRFLEHARFMYFQNGGQDELFIGSADLMPRNLDRRIEVLAPILDPELKKTILNEILLVHLSDNCKAWRLRPDGFYDKYRTDGPKINSQALMMEHRGNWGPSPTKGQL